MKSYSLISVVLTIVLASCTHTPKPAGSLAAFPVQTDSDGPFPQALAEGSLVVKNGCIRLEASSGTSYVMYWPYGYTYKDSAMEDGLLADSVEIYDSNGAYLTQVDDLTLDPVKISGGEFPQDFSNGVCGGKSWMAHEIEMVLTPPPLPTDDRH